MPKKVERKIERYYEKRGYSSKKSKAIAYKIMNKEGLLRRKKGRKR